MVNMETPKREIIGFMLKSFVNREAALAFLFILQLTDVGKNEVFHQEINKFKKLFGSLLRFL